MAASNKGSRYLRNRIKLILEKYGSPGVAVVATHNGGRPIFEHYGGEGSKQPGEIWNVKSDTIFLIASVSKLLTITTVLHCIEQVNHRKKDKSLSVDSPIEPYLRFRIRNPHAPRHKITFRELMDHTSGIVDNFEVEKYLYTTDADSPISMGEFCRWYLEKPKKGKGPSVPGHPSVHYHSRKNFDLPGIFSYSNAAYTLLGYLVERLWEKELLDAKERRERRKKGTNRMSDYCDEHILKPLGIRESGRYAGRFHLAQLEKSRSKMARANQNLPYYSFPGYANGGFRCTGLAYSRLLRMWMNRGKFRRTRILSTETAEAITDFTGRDLPWHTNYSYGFGFRTDLMSEEGPGLTSKMPQQRLAIGHTGGEHGIATCLYWVQNPGDLAKSIGVLVFTNTDWPPATEKGAPLEIANAIFDEYQGPVPYRPELPKKEDSNQE